MVGMAPIDALTRFTFGQYQLLSGFDIVVILIGVFAVTDIIKAGFDRKHLADKMSKTSYELKGFGISLKEFKEQFVNMIRFRSHRNRNWNPARYRRFHIRAFSLHGGKKFFQAPGEVWNRYY